MMCVVHCCCHHYHMFATFSSLVRFYVNTALYLMSYSTFAYISLIYTAKRYKNVFFVISSTKPLRLWWNLVYCFLSKCAAKSRKVFHLTRIMSLARLYCETWNSYLERATLSCQKKITPELISPQLMASTFARFESIWLQCVEILHIGAAKILAAGCALFWPQIPTNFFSRQCTIIKYPIKPLN